MIMFLALFSGFVLWLRFGVRALEQFAHVYSEAQNDSEYFCQGIVRWQTLKRVLAHLNERAKRIRILDLIYFFQEPVFLWLNVRSSAECFPATKVHYGHGLFQCHAFDSASARARNQAQTVPVRREKRYFKTSEEVRA
jgi:hypothetical protein